MRWALIVRLAVAGIFGVLLFAPSTPAQPAQKGSQSKSAPAGQQPAATKQEPAAKKDEPKPLFGGALDVRSSSDRKESATLGFKGIDPSGKLEQQVLGTPVTAADQAKLKALAAAKPTPAQLTAFLKEGKLTAK